ncbi:MAG: alpha/beta fold hydrolase [Leptospiraceae bacterium]|nr:alpha/beta fold hydrolase [Leptospiraceae bacterium]
MSNYPQKNITIEQVQAQGYTFTFENHKQYSDRYIVFLHGWCAVRYFWYYIIEEFYESGNCILFDLIGHNNKPIPKTFFSSNANLETFLKVQAEAIGAALQGKKVTLVGHSAGGLAALGVAALAPDMVEKVVTICPPAYGPIKGLLYPAKVVNDLKLDFINFTTLELVKFIPNLIFTWFSKGSGNEKEFLSIPNIKLFLQQYQKRFRVLNVKTINQYLKVLDKSDILPFLDNYKVPTLLIAGENDPLVSPKQFLEIGSKSDSIQIEHFYNSGHIPMMEERDKFLYTVKNFIKE